jgi:sodium bicarbonate transporter 10
VLWITDPKLYPETKYTRLVPKKWIHKFTLIQLVCFVVLWALKASRFGILFPLMIAALVPINMLIARYFPPEYIEALVSEDIEEEEEIHILD